MCIPPEKPLRTYVSTPTQHCFIRGIYILLSTVDIISSYYLIFLRYLLLFPKIQSHLNHGDPNQVSTVTEDFINVAFFGPKHMYSTWVVFLFVFGILPTGKRSFGSLTTKFLNLHLRVEKFDFLVQTDFFFFNVFSSSIIDQLCGLHFIYLILQPRPEYNMQRNCP